FFGLVDGLNFALQYQGKNGSVSGENDTGRGTLKQNGDGFGGSLTYDLGAGFGIGGAITSSKRTADQNAAGVYGSGDRATVYTGGLKYDANNVYLAAQYSQTYNATRFGDSKSTNGNDIY
ncbi:MAG: porin, partial [Citrobacter sp.]